MTRRLLFACALWLGVTAVAPAGTAGDWVVVTDAGPRWSGDAAHPLAKKLKELSDREKKKLTCVAFTPGGDWVVLAGDAGFWTSNPDLPVCKKLVELKGETLKCVAFTPSGGWAVFFGKNGSCAKDVPDDARKKIGEVADKGGTLRSVAFTPDGGWVLLCNECDVWMGGVPADAAKVLADAADKRTPVRCAAFTPYGGWFVLTGDGWKSDDADQPAAKRLTELRRAGETLRWVAFAPPEQSALKYEVTAKPSRRVKAVLTTDYVLPNADVAEWYVYAPQAPTLPSQNAVQTTFRPEGKAAKELSPLERPVLLSRVTGRPKELHTTLTIEATLYARRLRPVAPWKDAPSVKDLDPEEVTAYTRASESADYESKAIQEWMDHEKLRRQDGEGDVAFARRVFCAIRSQFKYKYPPPSLRASAVCTNGLSDCGGLSCLFVTTLRANRVPARLLQGRWALSEEPGGSPGQTHVKSEFFARGVGWVPVDMSAGVTDQAGPDFAHFGDDPGDHVVMSYGKDYVLDSFVAGKDTGFGMQGL
jgi:transglutaminase-like putative cysteine protease